MAALTADRDTPIKEGKYNLFPVKAAVRIFAGAAVCVAAATNYAEPGADAAGLVFAGIATEQVDNRDGAAGDQDVKVHRQGEVLFDATGTAPKVGEVVYLVDDHTVALDAGATNNVRVGTVTRVVSATSVWVDITR